MFFVKLYKHNFDIKISKRIEKWLFNQIVIYFNIRLRNQIKNYLNIKLCNQNKKHVKIEIKIMLK